MRYPGIALSAEVGSGRIKLHWLLQPTCGLRATSEDSWRTPLRWMDTCGTRIAHQAADVHGDTVHHWKAGQIPTLLAALRLAQSGGWSLVELLLPDFTRPLVDEAPAGEGNTARAPELTMWLCSNERSLMRLTGPCLNNRLPPKTLHVGLASGHMNCVNSVHGYLKCLSVDTPASNDSGPGQKSIRGEPKPGGLGVILSSRGQYNGGEGESLYTRGSP